MKRILALALLVLGAHAFTLDVDSDIVGKSRAYVGCAYQTGGTAPPQFDCSGFVGFILRPFVPKLPRLSRDMADFVTPVAKADLRPGDLVFFATTATPGAISHVALYIGDNSIIHAISDGPQRGVNVSSLDTRYWKNHYAGAGRVLPSAQAKPATPTKSAMPNTPAKPASPTTADKLTTPAKHSATDKPAKSDKPSAPDKPTAPAGAAKTTSPAADPWDSWDGYIEGDYAQWKAEQERKFSEFKKSYDSSAEGDAFAEWKKKQGL
jgi:hypothetical protein